MRKTLQILSISFTCLLLACSNATATPQPTVEAKEEASTTQEDNTSEEESLIVYFSRAGENYGVGVVEKGNTQKVAEITQEETGADLFEIRTVKEYSKNYMECIEEAKQELNQNARTRA